MKRKIGVITSDDYLYQKIYLMLLDNPALTATRGAVGADFILRERGQEAESPLPAYVMSREGGADLKIPFTEEELLALFSDAKDSPEMILGDRVVFLHDKEIKLTEVEFKLLNRLTAACPDFVTRNDLLESVWGGECDTGVVNVYIHYLRQKLEKSGNKVIISSRSYGYKIDEKYLKGGRS